ncbi:MAG: Spy/CpxP family protein refolding chaperone [Thiobacillus sp.]|nr:Spy/CpxP family protein refolding chaperone [Thiobacillus sp.]
MKLHTKLTLGLMSSLFVVSLATAAGPGAKMGPYHAGMDCNGMGMMSGDMKMDPVARANKHLTELKAKLNLAADQQAAWQAFSGHVNDQAKKMMSMRDMMKNNAQTMPKTAPEQMARMADIMKERSENMMKMADAVKTFYATLTPEQQAAFDKVHKSHMAQMK